MRRHDARIEFAVNARVAVVVRGRRFGGPVPPFRFVFPRD